MDRSVNPNRRSVKGGVEVAGMAPVSVKRAIKASGIRPTPAQVLAVLARVGVAAGWGRDDGRSRLR
jgi:hypothetical protein